MLFPISPGGKIVKAPHKFWNGAVTSVTLTKTGAARRRVIADGSTRGTTVAEGCLKPIIEFWCTNRVSLKTASQASLKIAGGETVSASITPTPLKDRTYRKGLSDPGRYNLLSYVSVFALRAALRPYQLALAYFHRLYFAESHFVSFHTDSCSFGDSSILGAHVV